MRGTRPILFVGSNVYLPDKRRILGRREPDVPKGGVIVFLLVAIEGFTYTLTKGNALRDTKIRDEW